MTRLTTVQRQKNIIDEAINIIFEKSYESFSIRELASRVHISEAAIYRHFLNKEDIIMGILNRFDEFENMLLEEVSHFDNPIDKIEHFILFHISFLEKNKELASVIFSETIFGESNVLREKFMVLVDKRKNMLKNILENSKTLNKNSDIDISELQTIILGYIKLVIFEWRFSGYSFSLEKRAQKFIKILTYLIKK